jgi:hypothetical protein
MRKEQVVASLGQQSLLMPAWVKAALLANDRLKLYLTMLQSAAQRAASPETTFADWGRGGFRVWSRRPTLMAEP